MKKINKILDIGLILLLKTFSNKINEKFQEY